jgi:hypothetical protein
MLPWVAKPDAASTVDVVSAIWRDLDETGTLKFNTQQQILWFTGEFKWEKQHSFGNIIREILAARQSVIDAD